MSRGFWRARGSGRPPAAAADSAGLRQTMASSCTGVGGSGFRTRANVYVARMNDYYWWDNHRPLPTWYAFWEVNTSLISPTNEPAR